jgi:class 3 adenylate cyclase/tetratricopeptide (TPR) repeat protein
MSEREDIEQTIAAIEARRAALGDTLTDAAIAPLRQQLAALDEQRKQVSVLFADMAGFTAAAGTMDPEDMRDIIRAYFGRLSAAITHHGGWIEKFIGDAIMAIFGIPTAHESDPERAVRAALDMQQALGELNEQLQRERGIRLAMRVGINTGPVVVSYLGGRQGEDFAAVGDTINLASRLEHAAPVGGILISHATYRHVRSVFDVQPQPALIVKGKPEPIQVYVVRRARPRTIQALGRGMQGVQTPLVGRDADLGQLQDALQAIREQRRARMVTVVGEAGVGKSRLLAEFIEWIERSTGLAWLFRARAGQEPGHRPYALLRDLFAFRFQIQDSDRSAEARLKLEQGIAGFMGQAAAERVPFIGHLIGFDYSASPHLQGILDNARQIRDRAFHYLAQFFEAVAADHPAVICLEDVHWADDSSLEAIEYLARACDELPVLFVALSRPTLFERRPNWGAELPGHTRLALNPLTEAESRYLATEILRRAPAPPAELIDLVVSRSEGNPFYLEELIKMLIEDGVIMADQDQWQVDRSRLADARMPPTLTGVLQARLDALPPDERTTLQQAAVVGRVFWDALVARLGAEGRGARASSRRSADPRATHDITSIMKKLASLEALSKKELTLVRPSSSFAGTQEYIFKHALLHQVTYDSLLRRRRRVYHTQAAEWLIEHSGERVGEYAGLIGEHFERAGAPARAADWYARAARQAQAIYASEVAIGYYRKVLMLLPANEVDVAQAMRRAAAYEGLGEMLLWQGRYDEAAAGYAAMRAAATTAGDAVAQARAWYGLAEVRERQGDYLAARESAVQVERIAEAIGADVERAMALLLQAWCDFNLGDTLAAGGLAQQALLVATEQDSMREMARGLSLLGVIYRAQGRYGQAADAMHSALELHRELGDRLRFGGTLNNLGLTAEARGDYSAAAARYQEALAIAREIKDRELEYLSLRNLGGAQIGVGGYAEGEAHLLQALQIAESAGWLDRSRIYSLLAEARLGQGDLAAALEAGRQALDFGQSQRVPSDIATAWRVLGLISAGIEHEARRIKHAHLSSADLILNLDPHNCFWESVRIFTEAGLHGERARTLRAWARYQIKRGNRVGGEQLWHEVRAVFVRLGMDGDVREMDTELPHVSAAG